MQLGTLKLASTKSRFLFSSIVFFVTFGWVLMSSATPTSQPSPATQSTTQKKKTTSDKKKPTSRALSEKTKKQLRQLWPFPDFSKKSKASPESKQKVKIGYPQKSPRVPSLGSISSMWLQTFAFLFALGVVVVLSFIVLRWASSRMGGVMTTGSQMKIHDRLVVEAKKNLWVVEVAGQCYLIASHEQGLNLIEKLDDDARACYQTDEHESTQSFWKKLRQSKKDQQNELDTSETISTQFEVVSDGQKKNPKENE